MAMPKIGEHKLMTFLALKIDSALLSLHKKFGFKDKTAMIREGLRLVAKKNKAELYSNLKEMGYTEAEITKIIKQ